MIFPFRFVLMMIIPWFAGSVNFAGGKFFSNFLAASGFSGAQRAAFRL